MSIEGTISELKNIPTNSLKVVKRSDTKKLRTLITFEEGYITLSAFACLQFIRGAELIINSQSKSSIQLDMVNMVFKLVEGLTHTNEDAQFKMHFYDLMLLRKMLEARMQHCEKQRDSKDKAFNADTYIGQKFLLLDLRELMLGQIYVEGE